jgi:hypothetical protein
MNRLPIDSDMPAAPTSLEGTGLPFTLILNILLKTLHFDGELSGIDAAARLGVGYGVLEPALDHLRREHLCEILGGSQGPHSYTYRLTESGHSRAAAAAEQSSYVGKLPVPLAQYSAYMRRFGRANTQRVTRQAVRDTFARLVLNDRVLDQLGPGIVAHHSIFIYGRPAMARRRSRIRSSISWAATLPSPTPSRWTAPSSASTTRSAMRRSKRCSGPDRWRGTSSWTIAGSAASARW